MKTFYLFIQRISTRLHDWLFELACRVLLPISTMCKVCNILRGIVLGLLLGSGVTLIVIALFTRMLRGC